MNIWQALILGAVQGFTEFLPVSSSGHLTLLQNVFGLSGNMLLFDTLLHVGTLVAVFAVLWKDIIEICKKPFSALVGYLIIATIPAVIAALFFDDIIEASFSSNAGVPLGLGFLLTSVLMFITPRFKPGKLPMEKMGVLRPFLIGVAQAIAIFPAISRSGSTIFTGLAAGVKREDVARFSFLMSIPAILGSVVFQAKDVVGMGLQSSLMGASPVAVVLGMLVAAITGYVALKLVYDTVRNGKLWVFGVYTTVLGLLVICDALFTHIVFRTAF